MIKVAVIGLGRFGQAVALELARMGHDVLAIDSDERVVNDIADSVTHALALDATSREALERAGLKAFPVVVVGIGQNIEGSILTTLLLKELGVRKVVARALNSDHGIILEKVGADKIVNPEREIGTKLARSIVNPELVDFIELGDRFSVAEMTALGNMVGKSLAELNLRKKFGVNIVAIKNGNRINGAPGPDDIVGEGDYLIVSGPPDNIAQIRKA